MIVLKHVFTGSISNVLCVHALTASPSINNTVQNRSPPHLEFRAIPAKSENLRQLNILQEL
jgi:hypothetical protein